MTIFKRWGVQPIINLCGSVTRLGGASMRIEAVEAFVAATTESVVMEDLYAAASRFISQVTGAESGLVTTGAAGALMLGTAAILAGSDLRRMELLPTTDGFPNEFIVSRDQRNGYDHAVRAAGARLVEVGMPEVIAGAGVRRTELWELEAAISPKTAGVLYVLSKTSHPHLSDVVAVAHAHGLPVLVDAAGELPPRSHLQMIVGSGADLVAFSGGKAIRGPQATGILCGRRHLIQSAALQMLDLDDHWDLWSPPPDFIDRSQLRGLPRHGIGRCLKVSKEQIVALLVALENFSRGDDAGLPGSKLQWLEKISTSLRPPLQPRLQKPENEEEWPVLEIHIGSRAWEICRRLRQGCPPIFVGQGKLLDGVLTIHPMHLDESNVEIVIRRLHEVAQEILS